jgi:hypothetical protein
MKCFLYAGWIFRVIEEYFMPPTFLLAASKSMIFSRGWYRGDRNASQWQWTEVFLMLPGPKFCLLMDKMCKFFGALLQTQ